MEKIEQTLKNLDIALEKLSTKESRFIFLSQDTKGNGKASVSYIYRMAKTLHDNGYNVSILHEKNDYINPTTWLGDEYGVLKHNSIENNDLKVGPHDFIIIPEIYGNILEQIQQMPVEKILLVQMYDHLLDSFAPGKSWLDYDVVDVITTSDTVSKMIEELLPIKKVKFINPYIPEHFVESKKPTTPTIAIHCKDQRKAAKIIKTFYLKYPIYRFISFKDMHGMTENDFANNLKDCAVSVWVDDGNTFGTFPLESLICNVPVIGKVPNILPEWMTDDNGIWVYDENQIPDLIFNYLKGWLEDTLPEHINNTSEELKNRYSKELFDRSVIETFDEFLKSKTEKIKKIKENLTKTTIQNEEETK